MAVGTLLLFSVGFSTVLLFDTVSFVDLITAIIHLSSEVVRGWSRSRLKPADKRGATQPFSLTFTPLANLESPISLSGEEEGTHRGGGTAAQRRPLTVCSLSSNDCGYTTATHARLTVAAFTGPAEAGGLP